MTTTYTITQGTHPNSIEVYFDSKPALDVLDALKSLKFRWNHKKACWYGFENESTVVDTLIAHGMGENIDGEQIDGATVYTDGYRGGGAVYGSKSNRHLYGAELSKAIRNDIKVAGIKGVSVKCKSYSGGQSITATVTTTEADYVSHFEYLESYSISPAQSWIQLRGDCVHIEKYFAMSGTEQDRIREEAADYEYERVTAHSNRLNTFYLDNCIQFKPEALEKTKAIKRIIEAYRYDESNSMVDYFDTNFYYDIDTKPATV